jgi:hypothetical protein
MFPVIYSSKSISCILVPSYDPLIEQYACKLGAPEKGAGIHADRDSLGYRAGLRMKFAGACRAPGANNPNVVGTIDEPSGLGRWTRWNGKPV